MYNASERVQFFQSESSFGEESSVAQSRYYDFTNEIISQTDNIFLTLKKELLPNEQLSQQEKVKYALTRAQIIFKDTIPEHMAYLDKIQAPQNARGQITACSQKLHKLLNDYQGLKSKTMTYKQFFNLYGREFGYNPEGNVNKKQRVLQVDDENEAFLKPECIQISYNNDRAKLKATPRVFKSPNTEVTDKEVGVLREQVYLLKKNIEDIKRKHDLQITNEKLLTEKRIRTYLAVQGSSGREFQAVRGEIEQYSFKLSCSEEENKSLKETIEQQAKTSQMIRSQNVSLKDEVQMLRKRDISMQQQSIHDKSYTSDVNDKQDKRADKRLKIALHENQLLKSQLKLERQKIYRITSDLTDQEKKELQRLKKLVEKKNSELEQLYGEVDRQRIELLQLTHNHKAVNKLFDSAKVENEQLKKGFKMISKQPQPNIYPLPSGNGLDPSMPISRKLQVLKYQGEGIEGLPYYEILSKEFKIRFKRACLKEKELLHKANGLEIGVISQYEKPNKIDMLLHLTNYGDVNFTKVKGKVLNANENKITGETFQFGVVKQSDQVKVHLSVVISHYPLGPMILLLEYQTDKREELRILLPVHIFKMMQFQRRDGVIKNPQRLTIPTQKKILRGLQDFKQYIQSAQIQNDTIKLSVFHRHTHTELHVNIMPTKEGVELLYEHYEGNEHITEYFVRTLTFLIRK